MIKLNSRNEQTFLYPTLLNVVNLRSLRRKINSSALNSRNNLKIIWKNRAYRTRRINILISVVNFGFSFRSTRELSVILQDLPYSKVLAGFQLISPEEGYLGRLRQHLLRVRLEWFINLRSFMTKIHWSSFFALLAFGEMYFYLFTQRVYLSIYLSIYLHIYPSINIIFIFLYLSIFIYFQKQHVVVLYLSIDINNK